MALFEVGMPRSQEALSDAFPQRKAGIKHHATIARLNTRRGWFINYRGTGHHNGAVLSGPPPRDMQAEGTLHWDPASGAIDSRTTLTTHSAANFPRGIIVASRVMMAGAPVNTVALNSYTVGSDSYTNLRFGFYDGSRLLEDPAINPKEYEARFIIGCLDKSLSEGIVGVIPNGAQSVHVEQTSGTIDVNV